MIISGLVFGLISTLHCAGMCGPLAMIYPKRVEQNKLQFATLYQLGRIGIYVCIGLIVYFIGVSFNVFFLQQKMSIVIGIAMLVITLMSLLKVKIGLKNPILVLLDKMNHLLQIGNKKSAFTFGVVNGLLPCGAIYVAAVYCLVFSHWYEAVLYMFLFGLGTLPVFIGAWLFVGKTISFSLTKLKVIYKFLPLLVGVLMILRGLNIGIPLLSPELIQTNQTVEINNCCEKD